MNLLVTPTTALLTVANGTQFNGAALQTLAGVGVSLVVDCSQCTGTVTCQLNGSQNITMAKGQIWSAGRNDIQFASVDFSQTSGTSQTVQLLYGLVQTTQLGSLK